MKKIASLIPHALIVISLMYQTFFYIDLVNTAMHFIDSDHTLRLFAVYSFLMILEAVIYIVYIRRSNANRALFTIPAFILTASALLVFFLVYNLIDPRRLLFSDRLTKVVIYIIDFIVIASSVFLCAIQRSRARKRYEKELEEKSGAKATVTDEEI